MVLRGSQSSSDIFPQTYNSVTLVPSSCFPDIFMIDSLFLNFLIESSLLYVYFPLLVILQGNWLRWPVLVCVCLFWFGQSNCFSILCWDYFSHHFLLIFLHLGMWTWFSPLKLSLASTFKNPNQCKIWKCLFPIYFLLEPTANDPRYLPRTFFLHPEIFQCWAPARQPYLPYQSPHCRVAASYILTGPLLTTVTATGKMDRVAHCPSHHGLWTKS